MCLNYAEIYIKTIVNHGFLSKITLYTDVYTSMALKKGKKCTGNPRRLDEKPSSLGRETLIARSGNPVRKILHETSCSKNPLRDIMCEISCTKNPVRIIPFEKSRTKYLVRKLPLDSHEKCCARIPVRKIVRKKRLIGSLPTVANLVAVILSRAHVGSTTARTVRSFACSDLFLTSGIRLQAP